VGLELGYGFGHKGKTDALWNGTTTDLSDLQIKTIQITPFVKAGKDFNFNGKKCKYYGIFGAGVYTWSHSEALIAGTTYDSASAIRYGFNLGGGATMEVAPQWNVGLDLRWHHVFGFFDNGDGTTSAANNITPTLKVAYTF
jgi:opacity protein-like surface antigen